MAGESRDQTVYKSFCSHVSTVESLEALQQWIIQKGAEVRDFLLMKGFQKGAEIEVFF